MTTTPGRPPALSSAARGPESSGDLDAVAGLAPRRRCGGRTPLRTASSPRRRGARARVLAHHSAEGYRERGAALTLALGKQGSEEGFSLSVSPRWGDPARATGELLHGPLGGRLRPGGPDPDRWTLGARASYGVSLPGGLKLDLQGSYGGASGGPGFGLRVARPATATTKPER